MGGSSKQVTGYQYFANFLLFIGNPIEKLLGINFDKRGWAIPLLDDQGNPLDVGTINKPNLFGENEGGIAGQIHARYGTANPMPVAFYTDYLAENDLPPLAYPFQSYLAFEDFYLGNSGYMKEMLLWPKRIHIKNDYGPQWYDAKAEVPDLTNIVDYKNNFEINNDVPYQTFTYYFADLEIGYLRDELFRGLPLSDGSGSNDAQGDVSNYKQSILNRVQGSGFLQFEFIKVSYLITYHTVEMDTNVPPGLEIFEHTEEDVSSEYPNTSGFKARRVTYICRSSATDIGLDMHGKYGFDGRFKFDYDFVINNLDNHQTPIYANSGDINPIHKIREILTDDTAMNKPEHNVNVANFVKAADRVWDEGLGISWAITEKSCIDAINELCSHIEAGIRVNRQTGLYEMVLFRDDWFKEDEIHTLAESKIKSISFEVQNADDVVNQLNVSYYDRNNIKNASFSISENASIKNMQGRVNAESSDFPYFMNQRNAAIVAQWKLKQFTTPCWKGSFTTGHNQARKWNRYDIVKLNWSRKGIADLPVRIMSINLGDGVDNTVSIDFVEVVPFSDELTSTVVIDDKIDVTPVPPQPILFKAFELSYFEAVQAHGQRTVDDELAYNPDAGYVAVVAQRSQNNSLNAQMHTDAGTGYENSAVIQYCETAQLDQSIDSLASSFIVKKVGGLASVRIGSQIFINNEIMVFQGFDAASKLLTVKRGALDTIPQTHADDSVLFFADDFVTVDSTEYAEGEAIDVKALSTTPSGILDLSGSDTQTVTIHSRAIRPYPPANVKINGQYFPIEIDTDLILTWVDRNRSQQTGGEILGWFESGVAIEANTQTYLTLIELDEANLVLASNVVNVTGSSSYTLPMSSMQPATRSVQIVLKTTREGYDCLMPIQHTVEIATFFSAPYNISATVSIV
ncbi:hypothetical protein QVL04_004865 [Escherichia coli]|nr:hypothetical protein [Escherichia coli]